MMQTLRGSDPNNKMWTQSSKGRGRGNNQTWVRTRQLSQVWKHPKCTFSKGSGEDIQCFPECSIFQEIIPIILYIVVHIHHINHSPYCYSNQHIILKEQVGLPALFQQVGPLVDDWESYLRGIAEDLDQHKELKNSKNLSQEQQLFTPVSFSHFRSNLWYSNMFTRFLFDLHTR